MKLSPASLQNAKRKEVQRFEILFKVIWPNGDK